MTYKYIFVGDEPNVFITLSKDGHTWVPSKGDDIELDAPVAHPLLELITEDTSAPVETGTKVKVTKTEAVKTEETPVTPEAVEPPVADDPVKES